jgi:antitoxin-like ribbon-helix-helix protein
MKTPVPEADAIPRKGLTLRLNQAAWRQLRQLAFDDERPAHELLIEALNDFFRKRKKPPLA